MRSLVVLCCLAGIGVSFIHAPIRKIQVNGFAQGTTYHITYYAADSIVVKSSIDSILHLIDESLSLYLPGSLINLFNASASGIPVDAHFIRVVKKAQEVFKQTDGLFDITVFPLTNAWGFGPQKPDSLPTEETVASLLPCVNSNLLYWEGTQLKKRKACVQLDANGIAQGYSVDVLADFLQSKGINNYLVELGGEIRVKGNKLPGNEPMSIGIEAPGEEVDFSVIERVIWPREGAVTTSGSYRRYIESKGQKITHLFNPKTGRPVRNELLSVTVYAKDAITADAFDNALMAMGLTRALDFVEQHPELAAHFIYYKDGVHVADTVSSRFRRLLSK